MSNIAKTNGARILDRLGIAYNIISYDVDETDLGAAHVAAQTGMPAGQVFKTLVVKGDKTGVMLACIPGDAELHLKNLALVSGNKKVEMAPLQEVQPLTGYVRGGVSPLGTKKRYPVYMDQTALSWPCICVSAGMRGYQLKLHAGDLIQAVHAIAASICRYQVTTDVFILRILTDLFPSASVSKTLKERCYSDGLASLADAKISRHADRLIKSVVT